MRNTKPSYLTLAATTLALGLGVAYTLAVGVAQGPSASSPESFTGSTEKVDCILGEIIPTPTVQCGQTLRVKKPILVAARNGGAPCPDEYVDFQGEECKCPDGSPIDPNRADCEEQQKDIRDGCCIDRELCTDGTRKDPNRTDCQAPRQELVDGCCRDIELCSDGSKKDPNRTDCAAPYKELVNGCCKDALCPDGSQKNPNRLDCIAPSKKLTEGCCVDVLCPDGTIRIPGGVMCKKEEGFKELDGCCECPCCGSTDPCCGSTDPCCGSADPCCGSADPCCGSTDPCCGSTDPCCGTADPCCGTSDPCCGSSDPCCGNSDPCCSNPTGPNCGPPDPCLNNPDPCCGNPDPCCGNPDPMCGKGGGGGGGKKKCEDAGDPGLDCMGPGCCGTSYCNPENGEWACKCFGSINAGTGMGSTPDEQCIDANGVRNGYYDYDTCGCKFDAGKCEKNEGEPCYNNGVACGVRSGPNCECPPDCNNNGDNFNN